MSDPILPPLIYEDQIPPAFDRLDHGILHEFIGMYLRVAYEAAYEDFRKRLGDEALKPGYFTILTLIVHNPRITQTQIGLASQRDKSNVTNALRWMEDNGLIVRHLSIRDRRTHMCVATQDGIEMQARMQAKAALHLQALNDAIGPERRTEFVRTLKDLIGALRKGQD
ncbi:DNA-binding transcriptional regulator, MarR family [Salinihabitans flavidus]|uniref:DNA-binding transcriptional regulator, MarR family n=1 Tax=Salinihabitans flavidus TaxID=569882 RepID=A0A1H8ML28_9RHOB|nr:MarR family transcriptional regulator [Salinihabitans flavidus]SEO18141.1 DNA-binding transcriptional regulator, MarR family [Salinihabitans flavidus]